MTVASAQLTAEVPQLAGGDAGDEQQDSGDDVLAFVDDQLEVGPAGDPQATECHPLPHVSEERLAAAAQLASLADETPEGRSIVVLGRRRFGLRGRDLSHAQLVPFSAQNRMSGVDVDGRSVRKGATDAVKRWVEIQRGRVPEALDHLVEVVATSGGTPLIVAEGPEVLGVVHLKDVVKEGIAARFDQLRRMGIRTVMVTGDNPLTARAIATEAGVDDFSRSGRRRCRHEHRYPGRQGCGQHGRPRFQPDQAHRDLLAPSTLVPVDAVSASASGLDPHISVANARLQAHRVAQVHGRALDEVLALIDAGTEPRAFGVLGEPRVNVLLLNLALDNPK